MVNVVASIDLILFADQQAIRNVMRGLHHRQNEFDGNGLATALMIFCLFFVCVWGVARMFVKSENGPASKGPQALFRELCRAHGLTLRDWWLLRRLARQHLLHEPAALFLDPRPFEAAISDDAWRKTAPRLRELRGKLFWGLPLRGLD